MIGLFLATYGAVFLAEIVGDKLLYTTGVLATRYRPMPIVIGATIAFMIKMGVAVAIGEAISHLPPLLVATLTTLSFLGLAYTLWRKPVEPKEVKDATGSSKAAMVSFAAIFFSEWGDIGQITAATMAARFPSSPILVWLGAVSAMVTKGILAASLGAGVRGWIQRTFSPRTIRVGGVTVLLVLGLLAVIETFEGRI